MPPTPSTLPAWTSLIAHIREYFYDPDIGALEIALSVIASHFYQGADPAWLFVLGPSGGDKGSIIVNCSLGVNTDACHLMGDLTPKTFLSGYTGAPNASLLTKIGSGVLVFKDFTTFLSKKEDEQAEIAAQLREIYDGYWKRNTGKGHELSWYGKMTVIAACTPAIERKWASLGDLGERFLSVRLARKNGVEQAEYAQRQAGLEPFIAKTMKELARQLFQGAPPILFPPPKLATPQYRIVSQLAELLAHARGKVPRHAKTDDITGPAEIENSGRASKELNAIVSGHAALFRRRAISSHDDLWVAQRVAANSIPSARYMLLARLAKGPLDLDQLPKLVSLPASTVTRHLADLECLDLITIESGTIPQARLSRPCAELWAALAPIVQEGPQLVSTG